MHSQKATTQEKNRGQENKPVENLRDRIRSAEKGATITAIIKEKDKDPKVIFLGHNKIVDTASVMIARLCKDPVEPINGGFNYLAVGLGDAWDPQNPPAPVGTEIKLVTEIDRKGFSDIYFVDPITGKPVVEPTNIVDFVCTFSEAQAVGALMELGIFGDATITSNSGLMIDYLTFPVVSKGATASLTLVVRMIFTFLMALLLL